MKREEIRWIPKKPDCEGSRRGFNSVGLTEVKPAVYLLLFGYGLSIALLISEILRGTFKNLNKNLQFKNPSLIHKKLLQTKTKYKFRRKNQKKF